MSRRAATRVPPHEDPSVSSFLLSLLADVLPDAYLDSLQQHVFHPRSAFQIFWRQAVAAAQQALQLAYPVVRPALDSASEYLAAHPEVVGWLALGFAVLLILMVARWVQRMVAFWVGLTARAVFWACVVGALAYVWQMGLYNSLVGLVVLVGKLAGYLAGVKDVWVQEYRRYNALQDQRSGYEYRGYDARRGNR